MSDLPSKLRTNHFNWQVLPLCHEAADEIERLESVIKDISFVVNRQAEDEGLWFVAETAAEAYLQQELRKLHAVIEAEV